MKIGPVDTELSIYWIDFLVSFFFFSNDCLDTNYLRIHWTDFRNVFTK